MTFEFLALNHNKMLQDSSNLALPEWQSKIGRVSIGKLALI